jgi:hypothetical protein
MRAVHPASSGSPLAIGATAGDATGAVLTMAEVAVASGLSTRFISR